jgi:hypothetical protein
MLCPKCGKSMEEVRGNIWREVYYECVNSQCDMKKLIHNRFDWLDELEENSMRFDWLHDLVSNLEGN